MATKKASAPKPSLRDKIQKKELDIRSRSHALNWFRDKVRESFSGRVQYKDKFAAVAPSQAGMGRMYFFGYDPLHRDILPFYDTFPLVVVIGKYDDGFLGMNLHYLPPQPRALLLEQLMTKTRGSGTKNARMDINWEVVNQIAKVKGFDRCVHRYLTDHIITPLVRVNEDQWETACLLPVQDFKGASAQQVWRTKK